MPNRNELSRAYQAGQSYILDGANTRNCHFTHFSSRECTQEWDAGNKAAIEKLLKAQTILDKLCLIKMERK